MGNDDSLYQSTEGSLCAEVIDNVAARVACQDLNGSVVQYPFQQMLPVERDGGLQSATVSATVQHCSGVVGICLQIDYLATKCRTATLCNPALNGSIGCVWEIGRTAGFERGGAR